MSIRDRFPDIAARHPRDPELDAIDAEPASSYLRAAFVDSLRTFAPDVRVDAFANVSLTGKPFVDGLFEKHAAEILLRLQNEIDSITDQDDLEDVQIGFQRIGIGSVVMHLKPVSPRPAEEDQMRMSAPPLLEGALLRILDLHDAFEAGDELLAAARATSSLATRARQLIESLDEADANIEVDLSRSDGSRRRSKLTDVGRSNARSFFERKPTVETVLLSGTLHTVSPTAGHIQLRSGKRLHDVVKMPPDMAKALSWDTTYRIAVRQTTEAAKAGRQPKIENEFIRVVPHNEVLPFEAMRIDES